MYDVEHIEDGLKGMMSPGRWRHSVRVKEQSAVLAGRLGAEVQKAEIAGILHDCARDLSYEDTLIMADRFGIILDNVTIKSPGIVHAVVGAEIAREHFGIGDIDVLNAIRYHTTGRSNMSLLEKIVFIADYVEPSRGFAGAGKARRLLGKSLDQAVLFALEGTICYLLERRQLIHPDTLDARNYFYLDQR